MAEPGTPKLNNEIDTRAELLTDYVKRSSLFEDLVLVNKSTENGISIAVFNGSLNLKEANFAVVVHIKGPVMNEDSLAQDELTVVVGVKDSTVRLTLDMFNVKDALCVRTSVLREDESNILPRGIGAELYQKFVFSFIQNTTNLKDKKTLHMIKHGDVEGITIEHDKWLSKFDEMLEEAGYDHWDEKEDGETAEWWQKLYEPVSKDLAL